MPANIENFISSTPPTPEQLFRLKAIIVQYAIEQSKVEDFYANKKSHAFVEALVSRQESMGEDGYEPETRHAKTTTILQGSSDEGEKEWVLSHMDKFETQFLSDDLYGWQSIHQFRWTEQRTLMARRSFRAISMYGDRARTIDYAFDHFFVPDDAAIMFHASTEINTVTSGDLDLMITDTGAYYQALREAKSSS